MNLSLWRKSIGETKWLLFWCSLVTFSFCWVRVWIVSRLPHASFRGILERLPEDFLRLLPVSIDELSSYAGRVGLLYEEPLMFLVVVIFAIARGSDAVSGELGRGTLEVLLAQPVRRITVLLLHATVTLAGVLIVTFAGYGGACVGLSMFHTPPETKVQAIPVYGAPIGVPVAIQGNETSLLRDKVPPELIFPPALNLAALGVFVAGVTTLLSACDRYRWRTIGLVTGFFVVQMIVKFVGRGVEELSYLSNFTFLTVYEPQVLIAVAKDQPDELWSFSIERAGAIVLGPLGYLTILVGVGMLAYAAAAWVFVRRDLPAPL